MLKDLSWDEVPETQQFAHELTIDGKFASDMVDEFIERQSMLVEVEGWPSGNARSGKEASRYCGMLNRQVEKRKIKNIKAFIRGNRVFLQKTIIRKMED